MPIQSLEVDTRIILHWILKKKCEGKTGFIWLRIETSDWLL
jgi:hypothetical protein